MSCKNVQILNFNHNIVEVGSDNKIVITDQIKGNNITIPQPVTNILQINSPGPQGPIGPAANTGSSATTGSNVFKGNQTITGSLTINNGSLKIDNGTSTLTAEPIYRKVLTITGSQINDLYSDTGIGATPQGVVIVDGITNKVLIPTKILVHAQLQVPVVGATTVLYFGHRVFNFQLSQYEYITSYRTASTFKADTTYTFTQVSVQQDGLLDGNNLNYPYLTFPSGNPIIAWVTSTSIRDADFSNLSSSYFVRFYVYYMIAPVSLTKNWIYG